MNLTEFIKNFSHNNIIRLLYKTKDGHQTVLSSWDIVSMDWEILKQKGVFRDYINNEVNSIVSILVSDCKYPEALNIVIEKSIK